tara:strand:- start:4898 stop:5170 length:273 start_codon:yes stop_codon:yes gene_type:complete
MPVPKITFIIKKWLRSRMDQGNYQVQSHEIETDLVTYGKEYWGRLHTPSTYSRAWRQFKSSTEIDDIDIKLIEPIKNGSNQTTWILKTGI